MFKHLQQITEGETCPKLTDEQKEWLRNNNMVYDVETYTEEWSYRDYDSYNTYYVMTFYDKEYYDKVVLPMKKAKAKKEENVNNGCLGIILLIILLIVVCMCSK